MRRALVRAWLGIVVLWTAAGGVLAEDSPVTRLSLQGLAGVGVRVVTTAEANKHVVTEQALRTAVEAQLRQTGIRVLSAAEQERAARRPCLVVSVALLPLSSGEQLYSIHVELSQWVASLAKADVPVSAAVPFPAVTWSAPNVFGIAPAEQIARRVHDATGRMVAQFVGAYQQANARPAGGSK